MHPGLDLGEKATLRSLAYGWADWVNFVAARCYERPANFEAMLVRPDGYIAWINSGDHSPEASAKTLVAVFEKWFGKRLQSRDTAAQRTR